MNNVNLPIYLMNILLLYILIFTAHVFILNYFNTSYKIPCLRSLINSAAVQSATRQQYAMSCEWLVVAMSGPDNP